MAIAAYKASDISTTEQEKIVNVMIDATADELGQENFKNLLIDMQNQVHVETLKAKYSQPNRHYTNALLKAYSEK